jgi:amidase
VPARRPDRRGRPLYANGIALDAARVDHPARLEARTRRFARVGERVGGRALRRALRRRERVSARVGRVFDACDVLLTPATAARPLPIGSLDRRGHWAMFDASRPFAAFTIPWNLTGQPAASVPAGFDDDGLPLGVQIVGRPDGESTLLALAAQLEIARPWAGRRPG